jgi:multidrug resistance efflux pump
MDDLKPIPTPAAQRWREFRIQALPILTFIGIIACIGLLWQRYVFPSNIIAQVEMETASVITTLPGRIEDIKVQRFQHVKEGQILAIVNVTDTNMLQASLRAVEADLFVMRQRIEEGYLRAGQTYERERLTYLEQLAQLQVDRVNAKLAEAEYQMEADLYASTISSSNNLNAAKYRWEAATTRVKEMENFLKEKQQVLPRLQSDMTNAVAAVDRATKAQQGVLSATTNLILRAPMDGIITGVSNHIGEFVMGGTPIITMSATEAEQIIAYMRPPLTQVPKAGDTLQIRRRTFKRQAAVATIREVGTQLEPIAPTLVPPSTAQVELGLPFAVNLPPNLGLVPGEIVDIIYEPKN